MASSTAGADRERSASTRLAGRALGFAPGGGAISRPRGALLPPLLFLILLPPGHVLAGTGGSVGVDQPVSAKPAEHVLREQIEHEFDALHAAVRFELDNCKAAVSLWQVSQAIGKRGRDFLDGSAERVTACMTRGRRETSRRAEQLLSRLPEETNLSRFLDRYMGGLLPASFSWGEVRQALADYMATVDAMFGDVAPRLASDGFENGELYRLRLDRMEETLNLKALQVRDAIAQH